MMDCEFIISNAPKSPKIDVFNANRSIFCDKTFTRNRPATSPDIDKIASIITTARAHQTHIAKLLLVSNEAGILSENMQNKQLLFV